VKILQRTLIFGGSGSLGKTLIKRLMCNDEVFIFSRDEAKQWTIRNEMSQIPGFKNVKFLIGDIRDKNRVNQVISSVNPGSIIAAAALKQVDVCELDPKESILTNVIGTQNIVDSVENIENLTGKSRTVLFVSTDKACSPANAYGMCKALSERLVTSMSMKENLASRFVAVRYGNVLESRGSIIPLFRYQAENCEHFTVTNPDMTRFVMTLDQSVDLISDALNIAETGETFVPRLPAMRIGDLAEIFSEIYRKSIKITGLRPGEKIHEVLINETESSRCYKFQDRFVIKNALAQASGEIFEYNSSQDVLSKENLRKHLEDLKIFERSLSTFVGKSIEEISQSQSSRE